MFQSIFNQWRKTVKVIVNYLRQLVTPVPKIQPQYKIIKPTTANNSITNIPYQKSNALTVGEISCN